MANKKPNTVEHKVVVGSLVSSKTRKPVVSLTIDGEGVQFDTTKAREVAGMLFAAAESAETDSFFFSYMRSAMKLDTNHAGAMLKDFRKYRELQLQHAVDTDEESELEDGG